MHSISKCLYQVHICQNEKHILPGHEKLRIEVYKCELPHHNMYLLRIIFLIPSSSKVNVYRDYCIALQSCLLTDLFLFIEF